jgi:MFS family permease
VDNSTGQPRQLDRLGPSILCGWSGVVWGLTFGHCPRLGRHSAGRVGAAGRGRSVSDRSMTALIAYRALQGIGAGGLMVNSQAIIGDLVPPAERGRYRGFMQSVFAFATIAGPLLRS